MLRMSKTDERRAEAKAIAQYFKESSDNKAANKGRGKNRTEEESYVKKDDMMNLVKIISTRSLLWAMNSARRSVAMVLASSAVGTCSKPAN